MARAVPDEGFSMYDTDSMELALSKLQGAVNAAHEGRPQTVWYRGQPYARIIPVPADGEVP